MMLIVELEIVEVKKYTESHEWVELDGNVGKSATTHPVYNMRIALHNTPNPPFCLNAIYRFPRNLILKLPATIGITEYAAKSLGDVVYVELPTADLEIAAGEPVGAVESVKSASDVLSPVSGKVIDGNAVLGDKPKTINESPESDGWIAKIEVNDPSELETLMDEKAYLESVEDH